MPTYFLDPRQVGTGAAPGVKVRMMCAADFMAHNIQWYGPRHDGVTFGYRANGQWHAGFDSEQDALRAASYAAGFGHVAEKPCALEPKGVQLAAGPLAEDDPECPGCHWLASTHPTPGAPS